MLIRALLALQLHVPGAYAVAPTETPGVLMERADTATEAGDHSEAAALYGRSYRALDPAAQADATGAFVVGVAAEAHLRAFDLSGEHAELDKAESLLSTFVATATAAHGAQAPGVAEANGLLERVRSERAAAATEPEPEPVKTPETTDRDPDPGPDEPDPEEPRGDDEGVAGTPPPPQPSATDAAAPRDRLGLGLVVGGALLAAGGVGVTIWGSRFVPYAEGALEREGFPEDHPEAVGFRDDMRRQGRNTMIAGGGLMAVGVGAIVWGAVRLSAGQRAKGRQAGRRAQLAPTPSGVVLHGRF